jgi:hypothetical protein
MQIARITQFSKFGIPMVCKPMARLNSGEAIRLDL